MGSTETGKHHRIEGNKQCIVDSSIGCGLKIYGNINGISCRNQFGMEELAVCKEIIEKGRSGNAEMAAKAIQSGYIAKQPDGSFLVTIPLFTGEQKAAFHRVADKYLSPIMPEYTERIEAFLSGYKKLFPKHLKEDVERCCYDMDIFLKVLLFSMAGFRSFVGE